MISPDLLRTAKAIVDGAFCESLPVTTQMLAAALVEVAVPCQCLGFLTPTEAQHRACGCPFCLRWLVGELEARNEALATRLNAQQADYCLGARIRDLVLDTTMPSANTLPVEATRSGANTTPEVVTVGRRIGAGGVAGATTSGYWNAAAHTDNWQVVSPADLTFNREASPEYVRVSGNTSPALRATGDSPAEVEWRIAQALLQYTNTLRTELATLTATLEALSPSKAAR